MHILLTDHLVCPRCGPEFGLILLAERIQERRVLDGALGCANCRERYPIAGGFADLRIPPAPPLPEGGEPEPAEGDEGLRLAALMGVAEGPGFSLIAGPAARLAPAVAAAVPELEVVAVDEALAGAAELPGVSRMAVGARLPLRPLLMRAVALSGPAAATLLEEAVRVLAPSGRLVLLDAPADAEARLEAAGLGVLAREGTTLVAGRG